MSRGGRGGGFGGRGGRGGGAPGGDDLKPDYSVTELFPPLAPPVQNPLTKLERVIVSRYRHHREKIHSGPLYTVMARKRGMEDPFNDVVRYSMKYAKRVRRAPKLDARPYVISFFPQELWATLGVEEGGAEEGGKAVGKKRLAFEALDSVLGEGEGDEEDEVEGDKKEDGEKEGEEEEEEEEKDQFSDDDDDDYNAEQYFEDGDDMSDGYGDDDGGGEDHY